ncbi:acyl-CoA thioesterase [Paenibacillus radicis (ex Xue et al. 2023)]|uniref:Acyl-CoA thioesterase n=1 Tax=Paenibacillus radicis (ex Xue et al. 2023) TaxID=2972489 RepID=A0ABT1YNC5_9BACL|nr:thioesterase family protein [Paenibacillus radicis (ex Xue et al. 2023)]MCR8634666.1 acyl-CoA thioesterase [Paenibacillus radicis (ex Xue et al. 2023)]
MSSSSSPWFEHTIRVRYQETDQMGVVYHANYLNWFEIGRTELIRTLGMPYHKIEEQGLLLPLVDAQMQFKLPAKYDDLITICTRIEEYTHLRVHFSSEIRRGTELLVSGSTRHVWVNRDWKPTRIDKAAPELYKLLQMQ